MARINVYIPDQLAAQARESGLNVSALTQSAIQHELAAASTDEWLSRLQDSIEGTGVSHDLGLAALDEARDATPTRHG
ncbi:MAG: type II toxin-antitoxin system CcdA family antitoxin [Actinomycetia bacterium]|nr:type II toxin-antitoxin system CcdA family antitoxin [Actinomycetes bacterium]